MLNKKKVFTNIWDEIKKILNLHINETCTNSQTHIKDYSLTWDIYLYSKLSLNSGASDHFLKSDKILENFKIEYN